MSDMHRLQENLEFVRGAVTRGRVNVGSPALYFLWAAITGVGFSLPEILPEFAAYYWAGAILIGSGLSVWLGRRHTRMVGVVDRDVAHRQGMHWLASGVAISSVLVGVLIGRLRWDVALPPLVSATGLAYLLAGIHLHPPLRWVGVAFLVSGLALWGAPAAHVGIYAGVAIAGSLCVAGSIARRKLASG